ncbi:hypothetical protein DMB65_00715 [Flavobacterium cheongpyeongense]|uniref:Ig-like domain-containing protein n=1 Tax=Flavobacterium cheongpyeongense TaxID=2212651 RepID=A0A2V4BUC6_9FLAO|nr:T9SS type B sorting domain-containing protein [Flavobacterium cheongpyeongense]PXY42581.1 hypothetical protein DMB65_00715 [Flavobacterium cheongpyeongense]
MKHTLLLFFFISTFTLFSQNKNQSIGFKENKGQIIDQKGKPNTAVKYLLNSNGLNVQLKKNGFSYDIYEVKKIPVSPSKTSKTLPYQIPEKDKDKEPEYSLEYKFHRVDIDFVNSNSKVALITDQESKDFDNYYNVPNKPEGIVGVHQYKQITYKNIYPNIDIVFTVPDDPQKTVEYNFVIHPKGKISDIQLKFNGTETALVDNKIQMNVCFGKMEEILPASWIEDGTCKKEVPIRYRKIKKGVYGFNSPETASDKTIIIDPVPVRLWGTYYGGGKHDFANYVFYKDNCVYLTGDTYSSTNIATTGNTINHQNEYELDSYIVKFNKDGIRLWGTYFGGDKQEHVYQIKVSDNQNVYVVGETGSDNNISTSGSYQPDMGPLPQQRGSFYLGYFIKFDSNGQRKWGTYYWGTVNSLTIDSSEKIYISGVTSAHDKIATPGSYQPNFDVSGYVPDYGDKSDGFIAKFDSEGNRNWATYYGGSGNDWIQDCKIDSNGFIYFLGTTESMNNISSINLTDLPTYANASSFLVKFDSNGNRIWGTYFGGEKPDYSFNLGIDSNNNLYTFGWTQSLTNISTVGAYQEMYDNHSFWATQNNGFIFKFDSNGNKIWGTYFFPQTLGGSVSKNGDIYFAGTTSAVDTSISTPNAFMENYSLDNQAYLVKFDTNGKRKWGTYHQGIAFVTETDNNGNVYLAGLGGNENNIATPGTHQPYPYDISKPSYDAFLVKFKDCESSALTSSNSPVCIGKTLELKASGGTNYSWTGPNGFTSTDQNPTIPNTTTANSGEYSCLITGTGGCDDTKKIIVVIGDVQPPFPNIATLPTITGDCHTTINTIPTATDACSGIIIGITTDPLSYTIPGNYTIVWNYNDANGNVSLQNQTVTITNQPLPVANSPQTFCMLKNATLADIAITGQNIKWYNNLTTGIFLPQTTTLQNGLIYYASQTINGCESARTPVTINIQNTLLPTGNSNQSFCTAQNPTIADIQITGQNIKWYDAVSNGSLLAETTNLVNGRTYYASQTENNCEGQRLGITVSIVNTPPAPTGNGTQSFCKNENATLSSIQISGQDIKWYNTNFSAASLPNSTLLENNRTYYASQTVGCESDRTAVLVKVYDTSLPTGNRNQQFCIDQNATIANLDVTGTSLKWYDSASNGNILSPTTLLQNSLYYVTQTLNDCESERLTVNVKIQDTQSPIADSPQTFCIQKKAKISNIDIEGQNIQWFESISSSVSLSESTLLENGITYYASQTVNNCESERIPVLINILGATTADCINFIKELPYPKFFTPNNDYQNDTWTIDFAYLKPNTGIRIFDRYGKFLKEIRPNSEWDGTYTGQDMPASDYWFTVTRLNGTEYRGHFSLKR